MDKALKQAEEEYLAVEQQRLEAEQQQLEAAGQRLEVERQLLEAEQQGNSKDHPKILFHFKPRCLLCISAKQRAQGKL